MTDTDSWPAIMMRSGMHLYADGNTTDDIIPGQTDNPNSNRNLSALGMVETLGLAIGAFVILIAIFESNRFYKQIYLKRLQNRFQVS
jgi:hypothetical protein